MPFAPQAVGQFVLPGAHAWQTPFTQTCALGHAVVAVHCTVQPIGFAQPWQAPFTHSWPAAHGVFGPHCCGQLVEPGAQAAWQTPFTQARLAALQLESVPFAFGQHTWPAFPHCGVQLPFAHGWQSPFKQLLPAGQATPAEQV